MTTLDLNYYANQITGYGPNETVLCLCDADGSSFEISLPDAEGIEGNTFTFKKVSSGLNTITLKAMYGQNIDGSETFEITDENESVTIVAHNNKYYITGYYAG